MLSFTCSITCSCFFISVSFFGISIFCISSLSDFSIGYSVASSAFSFLRSEILSGSVVTDNNSASFTSLSSLFSFESKKLSFFVNLFEGVAPVGRDALCATILS